ncbi:shikimate kinase [Botrimarina hoheduenensis]|uniref:Shikimate kinase n=1 Tax=Botrimarina hoheduenensis TaxID=2528000 RepID=A0A5C5VTZ5_9BACT|nr:shikimate kinase [Botrimarina hoheduenensis]TWT41613.1 Shikimate kinase [Botrimarina hoheduenensis]
MKRTNLVLIGMPGSGKSTVGVVLAKRLSLGFVDTDLVIQAREGRPLQATVDALGYEALRDIEEQTLLELAVERHVIATGGSVIYSEPGMSRLAAHGVVVHLDVPLDELVRRVGDFSLRGIAMRPDQSFANLFAERRPLYAQHAQHTIDCQGLDLEQVCQQIIAVVDR